MSCRGEIFRGILSYLWAPFNEGKIEIDIPKEEGGQEEGEGADGERQEERERKSARVARRPEDYPRFFDRYLAGVAIN